MGRPGWHIECSVMSTDILKDIDIHSGGIDLIYPHHQSEILQCVAHSHSHSNLKTQDTPFAYFLHSGHLNINGEKMSKSLKNFTSVKEYLENVGTAQDLRMMFLMHKWHKSLDYSVETLKEATYTNKRIQEMIDHLKFIMKENMHNKQSSLSEDDENMVAIIKTLKQKIHDNLTNNFDTSAAIRHLLESINEMYKYLENQQVNIQITMSFYRYIVRITQVFGLSYEKNNDYDKNDDTFIKLAIDLREDIRKTVMETKKGMDGKTMIKLLSVLDNFRDVKLKDAGVLLQDRSGDKSTKYVLL